MLPEHERIVIALHYFASQSLVQISSFLEISTNTAKQRLHLHGAQYQRDNEHGR